MKRTTILLEEGLLLEVQQLAKQYQMTTSQVIQRAIADYVERERQMRLHPPRAKDEPSSSRSSRRFPEPIRYVRETTVPTAEHAGDSTQSVEGTGGDERRAPRRWLLPIVLGALSALLALFELAQAIGQFAVRAQILEVVINYLLPAILLGVVAGAFFFVASQNRRLSDT